MEAEEINEGAQVSTSTQMMVSEEAGLPSEPSESEQSKQSERSEESEESNYDVSDEVEFVDARILSHKFKSAAQEVKIKKATNVPKYMFRLLFEHMKTLDNGYRYNRWVGSLAR